MREKWEAVRRELADRFGNKKTATVSVLLLFSLLFLCGSAQRGAQGSCASEAGPGMPSAGGVPARAKAGLEPGAATELASGEAGPGPSEGFDRGLCYCAYRVARGDTLSDIAAAHDVSLDTVVSFNGIKSARSLRPGDFLKIPSMSGILYQAKAGDSAASIAAANGISADRVVEANGLGSASAPVEAGRSLFLPDARLASFTLREISGDLFGWPARGWTSSWYGWRKDPFTGVRTFHNGIDIGVDSGTPVRAAMDGSVSETGYNSSFGNYVILYHHAGWMSLYGHLESISVKEGQRVAAGQRIAYSGNTGYSTGPHLHFSVFKNGRTVNPFNVLH